MESLLQWLVTSSANPEKVSATIKGFLLAHIGIVIMIFQYLHLPYSHDQIISLIGLIVGLFGCALSFFGICRKLYYALKG